VAVITTDANETVQPIHHRMPVVIDATDVEIWLGTTRTRLPSSCDRPPTMC